MALKHKENNQPVHKGTKLQPGTFCTEHAEIGGSLLPIKEGTLKLVANLSARTHELWKLLEPLPEAMIRGNMHELQKSLTKLNRLVEEQMEEFQSKVSPLFRNLRQSDGIESRRIWPEVELTCWVHGWFFHLLGEGPEGQSQILLQKS